VVVCRVNSEGESAQESRLFQNELNRPVAWAVACYRTDGRELCADFGRHSFVSM
jgi:hypothetical protein